jgi:hypothetical protein
MQTNAMHVRGADWAKRALVGAHVCRSLNRQGETASLAICFHARNSLNGVCRNDGTSPWWSSLRLLPPRLRRRRRGFHNGPDLAGEQSQIAARGEVFCYVPTIPLLVPDKQLLAPELLQRKWDRAGSGKRNEPVGKSNRQDLPLAVNLGRGRNSLPERWKTAGFATRYTTSLSTVSHHVQRSGNRGVGEFGIVECERSPAVDARANFIEGRGRFCFHQRDPASTAQCGRLVL